MLKTRAITAVVGVPFIALSLIYFPKFYAWSIFACCTVLSAYEMLHMIYPRFLECFAICDHNQKLDLHAFDQWIVICLGFVFLLFISVTSDIFSQCFIIFGFLSSLLVLLACLSPVSIEASVARISCALITLCYSCPAWFAAWKLYLLYPRAGYLLLVWFFVMIADTSAYFIGKYFGRHSLAPQLSPSKTWEGALGAMFSGILAAWLISFFIPTTMASKVFLIFSALLITISCILGDLIESSWKRFAQVKDSGIIVPGHGGFLDRMDGFMIAAPVFWVFLDWAGGVGS